MAGNNSKEVVLIKKHLYTKNGKINDELLSRNIVVYGCGKDGKKLIRELQMRNATIKALFDSNPDLWGKSIEEIQIKPLEELFSYRECNIVLPFFCGRM